MLRTALIAAVLLIAPLSFAHAQTAQTVSVKGRDLSTPQGARGFYRDLARAAADVCGGQRTTGGLSSMDAFDRCYAATIRQAVAKANAPLVTAAAQASRPALRIAGR